tara:strand:+ start:158 stop:850 length:693 start_codon:yes stop_codon:yes gene_type:complete
MKIKTALILCAGFGKRLYPITSKNPKPLLEINNFTLLENTINLVKALGMERILINTFHLKSKIRDFINNNNFNIKIDIIEDGEKILDTGGGIKNMVNYIDENIFLVFNPDTVWDLNYVEFINKMYEFFLISKAQNILLVADKKLSFDKNLEGDFSLEKNLLYKNNNKNYIYTGCQIISKNLLKNIDKKFFSINEIWSQLINRNALFGFKSTNKFYHVTDLEIYNKILKNN